MISIQQFRRYCLFLYAFSINYEVFDISGAQIFSLSKVAGLLYLISFIGNPLPYFSLKGISSYLNPFFIFYIFLILMNILNVNYYSSAFIDTSILTNIIFFIVIINHARYDEKILEKALIFYAIGSISVALFYYFGIGIENTGGRISIFGDNENSTGNRMTISLIIIIYNVVINRSNFGNWRYILLFPTPLMIKLMAETGSRSATIGLMLSLTIFFLLYKTKRIYTKFFISIIGIICIYFVYNYIMNTEVLVERLNKTAEEGNLGGRDEIWIKLFPLFLDNLVIGVGKTGYDLYALKNFGGNKSPHNVIVEVLAYTGIIGLVLYLIFYFRIFILSIKTYFINKFYLGFLLFIPLFGMLLAGHLLNSKIAYLIYAVIISQTFLVNHTTRVKNTYIP